MVKVGGGPLADDEWVGAFVAAVARRTEPTVIVHGGGQQVSTLQLALGSQPEWRDGLRVTTAEAMAVVQMVLSGAINKRLVAALVDLGVDALGLSGEDAGLLQAEPLQGGGLGRAGEVRSVRGELLERLLAAGLLPVVSSVSRGADGGPMNVNADTAAAAVASALGAPELLLVSDVSGVLRDGEVLGGLAAADVEEFIAAGSASGGMIPKLRAASYALAGGVGSVRIGGLEMLNRPDAGTRIGGHG